MRTLLRATLNRFVGNKPGIAATTPVLSFRVRPARNIALVGVRDTQRQAIDRRPAFRGEMENVFVTIVQVTRRADRIEMAARTYLASRFIDRDRLDPMDRVLENEQVAEPKNQLVR